MESVGLKILYSGGMKSGKSKLAELKALELSPYHKPIYLATNELKDSDMLKRIEKHKIQRKDRFATIEEGINIYDAVKNSKAVILIDCITIWINNMLYHKKSKKAILSNIKGLLSLNNHIIFVLNEVGLGIIPDNSLARRFIDLSGDMGQLLAKKCNEVYFCQLGLSLRLK